MLAKAGGAEIRNFASFLLPDAGKLSKLRWHPTSIAAILIERGHSHPECQPISENVIQRAKSQLAWHVTVVVACHANPDKLTASDKRKSGIFGEWQLSFLPTYFRQARTGGGALFRGVDRTALEL